MPMFFEPAFVGVHVFFFRARGIEVPVGAQIICVACFGGLDNEEALWEVLMSSWFTSTMECKRAFFVAHLAFVAICRVGKI